MWRFAAKETFGFVLLMLGLSLVHSPAHAQPPLLGFKMVETPVPPGPDRDAIILAGFPDPVSYRFSVCFSDPGWQLLSCTGEYPAGSTGPAEGPFLISTTGTFYQNAGGGPIGDEINPNFYSIFPGLLYDSWLTIKYDDNTGFGSGATIVTGTLQTFETAGGNILWETSPGGGIFVVPSALDEPQTLPDANNSILLGQFTVNSGESISCAMTIQFRIVPADPMDTFVFVAIPTTFGTADGLADVCVELFLPLDITYFNAYPTQEHIVLDWETQSENNSDFFEIFRSTDLENWVSIGQMGAAGNSQSKINYRALDRDPEIGTNYYKIRQANLDGTSFDSDVLTVDWKGSNTVTIYPNPTQNSLTIDGDLSGFESFSLLSADGKILWETGEGTSLESNRIINTEQLGLSNGFYFMRLQRPNGTFEQHQLSIFR